MSVNRVNIMPHKYILAQVTLMEIPIDVYYFKVFGRLLTMLPYKALYVNHVKAH